MIIFVVYNSIKKNSEYQCKVATFRLDWLSKCFRAEDLAQYLV